MSLLPSGAIETGGYNINNSLRFRSSASAYLTRTPTSTGNQRTFTFSGWVKRGTLGANNVIMDAFYGDSGRYALIWFNSSDCLRVSSGIYSTGASTTTSFDYITTQVFRDPSAWYHIVIAVDTTQSTSGNRVKIYVNGNQVTSFSTSTAPTQNDQTYYNVSTTKMDIGYYAESPGYYYLDGYLADINWIDGQALTPSSFGETDAVTGSWVAKKYTGTYGTNGFYLPFSSYSTTGGVFSSYYGNFNSTGTTSTSTLLSINDSAVFNSGSSNFCWETFFYPTTSSSGNLFGKGGSNIYESIAISYNGSTGIAVYISNPSNSYIVGGTYSSSSLALNKWNHVAVYRSGSSWYIAINGNVQLMATSSDSVIDNSGPFIIGGYSNASNAVGVPITGRMSNLRYVVGSSVYGASNFTPPTSALTAISGTQLLTLQNSSIVDNSANALTITQVNASYPVTTTSSSSIGYLAYYATDSSGNANNWLVNNMNVTTSTDTTYDAMTDSPTLTSATVGNYCTINPLLDLQTYATYSEGNLKVSTTASAGYSMRMQSKGTMAIPSSGKWYFAANAGDCGIIIGNDDPNRTQYGASILTTNVRYQYNGDVLLNNNSYATVASFTVSDEVGFAIDMDALTVGIYKNGSLLTTVTGVTSGFTYYPMTVAGSSSTSYTAYWNFGQRPFTYTPPTGYKTLNTYNLPDSTIKKGNKYMDATLYTGTAANQTVVNAGSFKPDLVWTKGRSYADYHALTDSVRGASIWLASNTTGAEANYTGTNSGVKSFVSNGFTLEADGSEVFNKLSATYVAWQWQAGQGTTSTNTQGSITSTVSVNATAGFSVVTYTGNGTAGATIGHGLGVAPKFIFIKRRNGSSNNWALAGSILGSTEVMYLNLTNAKETYTVGLIGNIQTSTTFQVGNDTNRNDSGGTYVAYCWAEIAGFSKFGSYTGNGSADGPFVYTGFRPKYVLIKRTDTANDWYAKDTSRDPVNAAGNTILVDLSDAEFGPANTLIDILSNGFKSRTTSAGVNASSGTYIYMAFAENPFKNSLAR